MNVLSLFDGRACCRIALERAGIQVGNYYASEIDKNAIKVAQANWPDNIQLGDVTKWQEWGIDWASIDLVTGGFPCQAWSIAGKQLGDKDERGMLFWTMLDIMKRVREYNPKAHFLIENVKMKKEFEEYITHHTEQSLGEVHKILINSALVSAQNRNRYYWTSFPSTQPEDKGVVLAEILENGGVDQDKSYCIDANYFKGGNLKSYFEKHRRQLVFCGAMRGRYIVNGKRQDPRIFTAGLTKQRIEVRYDGKTNALTTVQKDNNVVYGANGNSYYDLNEIKYRKLTPTECERLQTVPDNYTAHVSNTQRYKMLGKGWTVDVIVHLLQCMKQTL
ncbi:TPA: DNA cytosine methyltransferase [Vibrio cholerae]|nr:DNA cytosine methyltransferase [Vibrio cholerae]